MAREFDAQLIESVAVRRARMRDLLLWGRQRRARSTGDGLRSLRTGVVLAAIACAVCVGWSFLHNMITEQRSSRPGPVPTVSR